MTTIRSAADARVLKLNSDFPSKARLTSALTRMIALFDMKDAEVSLSLVSDETIRKVNSDWRKKDKATDVLSFPLHELPMADLLVAARTAPMLLGDIMISIETTVKQAKSHKHTATDEALVLMAHGLLHLLGFDHRTDDEEREMDAFASVLVAAAKNRKTLKLSLTA